jgi:hypothetical protein
VAEAFALVAEAAVVAPKEAVRFSVEDEDEGEESAAGEVEDNHKEVVSFDLGARNVDIGSLVAVEGRTEQYAAAVEESARVVWRWDP